MKKNVKRIVTVNLTLDSSEMIMFTKGGIHKIKMNLHDIFPDRFNSEYDEDESDPNDDFIITVQMESVDLNRYNFISGEACRHKQRTLEEEKKFDKLCEENTNFTGINKA